MADYIMNARLGLYDIVKPPAAQLGVEAWFMDKDWSADPDGVILLSGVKVKARYVLNTSGGTLGAGLGILFKNTALGKELNGLSGADGRCDGVIDPFLPSGLPNNSYGWIITFGPTKVMAGSGGVTQGDALQTAASGKFITVADGNTYASGRAGIADATAAADNLVRTWLNLNYQALCP